MFLRAVAIVLALSLTALTVAGGAGDVRLPVPITRAAAVLPSPARQRRQGGAYSVAEFCHAFGLSVPMLYKLWAKGKGPAFFKVGTRTLISDKAAAKWVNAAEKAARRQAEKSAT